MTYDAIYRASQEYRKPYHESFYYPLWRAAAALLPKDKAARILELGCGTGQFAAMLHGLGYRNYTGVDISKVAVGMAQAPGIVQGDAFKWLGRHDDYDVVIALETFEHLDDRKLAGLIKPGTAVIFSVPNFAGSDHKRHFATGNKVKQHYSDLLDFTRIGVPLRHGDQRWFLASARRKRLHIAAIIPAYNEIEWLPLKLKWCQRHHLDPYVLDNYSTDGTWEYLQRHRIKSSRVDTRGAFDLDLIQAPMPDIVRRMGADWAIYNSVDLFFETEFSMDHAIAIADAQGYNLVEMQTMGMFNTGEPRRPFDPFNTYFYMGMKSRCFICMINRVDDTFLAYHNDGVVMTERRPKRLPGIIMNMGMTKPAEQREETKERRLRAAQAGSERFSGAKYKECSAAGWVWPKSQFKDIRKTTWWKYYRKLGTL